MPSIMPDLYLIIAKAFALTAIRQFALRGRLLPLSFFAAIKHNENMKQGFVNLRVISY